MKRKRWQAVAAALMALLGLLGCEAQESATRDPAERRDAGRDDGSSGPVTDAGPAADARPSADAGAGSSCQVGVDVLNEAGQAAATTECRVTGPTGTCMQLIECICVLTATPEDQEHCVWALLGPRALIALGDFCNDGRDLAAVCAIEAWQENGPQPIRVRAEPDCSAVPAN